ncbi:MAG: TerB family tellurite resistance protein [Woeseiaceae bacterium]
MHILIAFLGSLVTVFYLLDRLGIDIGGFNPFHWRRKRKWMRQYHADPIYSVEDPMHVAALLILGAAKLDGVISTEQKKVALEQFEATFSLTAQEASELVGSAVHLLGSPQVIDAQLKGLAEKNKASFTKEQADSMLQMMDQVCAADGQVNAEQSELIDSLRATFVTPEPIQGTWS